MNKFFSNAKNPGISVYHDFNPVKGHMKNQAVLKYKNHPSIIRIREAQKYVSNHRRNRKGNKQVKGYLRYKASKAQIKNFFIL